ncbi:MAG: prepilin-type N-terminal cleavage/methylation domain-containing protein [Phycisphaeraceae bacterium]|nr:prepilin-type N-terminal cleavage/methylation domain-containing protein [Phycisphaeraceae bacterium]
MIGRRFNVRGRQGFTLIDLMIVIVILGVLAAIVLPLVSHHLDNAQQTAAQATLNSVEKAVEMYRVQNNAFPGTLDDLTFQTNKQMKLPPGYSFLYDNTTGVVTLVTP